MKPRQAETKRKAVTRRVGPLVILLQGTESPTETEWAECLHLVGKVGDINSTRVLVVTAGGGPTLAQRRALEKVLAGTKVCSAVVSDSVKVRFILASVALFSTQISTFQLREIHRAYEFLGLTHAQVVLAEKALTEMRAMLA